MLTIKAEIKRSELKVDGTYNVKIRFTLDRKVKRLSTNLFVTQQDLTKSLKFKEDTSIKREIDRLVLYLEKPLNFDPFGHARFAHLFVLYD